MSNKLLNPTLLAALALRVSIAFCDHKKGMEIV